MNDREFRYRPDPYVIGKKVLIVLIVLASALSFTFGYFVGRKGEDARSIDSAMLKGISLSDKETDPDKSFVRPADQSGQESIASLREGSSRTLFTAPSGEASSDIIPLKAPEEIISSGTADKAKEEKTMEASVNVRPPSAKEAKVQASPSKMTYTVQLAAFNNQKDAEKFGEEFDKKGYKSYIVSAAGANGETMHKVRVGEFRERKEAEVLSVKIKKIEGLNSFVTYKKE